MARPEPIKAARGVRDLVPRARPLWRAAERAAEETARRFGYEEIVTPIIEQAELIERIGEHTDAVSKELYRIVKRGNQNLALRPEATAGVVRAYFENALNQGPRPGRFYLIGPMFRYDKPQKGRYREFHQFNIEVIGGGSAGFDAEVIELACEWLREAGLRDVRLELNSIGDSACRPAYLEALRDYYRPLKDRLSYDSQQRLEHNPLRLLDSKEKEDAAFKARAPRIVDHLCDECAAHFAVVRRLLDAAEIEYVVNPYLVRGLDYYTRTVFEIFPAGASGQQDALAAGGRYDGLAEAEGWPPTPGVGFASGIDRVTEQMAASGEDVIAAPAADVVVLADGDLPDAAAQVARICRAVRPVAVDYEPKSLKAKMNAANKLGAKWVVIINGESAERRTAQLKDMQSGAQQEVAWQDLPARLA